MKRSLLYFILVIALVTLAEVAYANKIAEVRATVYAWGSAWESRNIAKYSSFYSPVFRSKGLDYQRWMQNKAEVFQKPGDIQVKISDLWVFIEGSQATARFVQQYQDPRVLDVGEKKLVLVNTSGKWQIVSEEWKPLAMPAIPTQDRALAASSQKENTKKKAGKPTPSKRKTKDLPPAKIRVTNIKFSEENHQEKVCIVLNSICTPDVKTLNGTKPRVVIDINNVPSWSGSYITPANGKMIQQIRTYLHRDIEKLRIVLDLNPAQNYSLDQSFNTKENVFCIAVKPSSSPP